jgi:tetratricopeptide (TPR) repeat protein
MCQPLVAGGEFVLYKQHLEAIGKKPPLRWGSLVTDNVLNFMRADLAVLQRDEAALRKYAPLALETATRDGHVLFQASAERALGVLHRLAGDYGRAAEHLRRALYSFEKIETRWQLGRTLAELGELAAAQTNYGRANDYYVQALEAFTAMEANPDSLRAQKALDSLPSS